MRRVVWVSLISLKGKHLIRVVCLVFLSVKHEARQHLLCSRVGGILCHASHSHAPRLIVHVLVLLMYWVGERTTGPAQ